MLEGLLPIGSVVLLKESTRKIMIIGVAQNMEGSDRIYDYSAVIYPQGYLGGDRLFLFDNEQIDKVYHIGFQDDEQFEFKAKADVALKAYREKEAAAEADE